MMDRVVIHEDAPAQQGRDWCLCFPVRKEGGSWRDKKKLSLCLAIAWNEGDGAVLVGDRMINEARPPGYGCGCSHLRVRTNPTTNPGGHFSWRERWLFAGSDVG